MKKILHISKYYYPFKGGTEQTAQDCVAALKGEFEQKVFCFNHEAGDKKDFVDGVEVNYAGCFAKVSSQSLSLSYGRMLENVIDEFHPDIIVFHYPNPFGAHYLLKNLRRDVRLILYWHLDIVKQVVLRKFFFEQNRRLIQRADRIIATSPNYIEGSRWLRRVRKKCTVIPSCINEERLAADSETLEAAAKLREKNQGKMICVALGRHTKYKGFEYLIKASELLDDHFVVYLIGDGELTAHLKKMASGNRKVVFLGRVSDKEMKAYLLAMDIFCFPSITKNEAFGVALAEAMYYSKPAVTFTIKGSGVNYVNIGGETGIEVENKNIEAYAQAIMLLADNEELREEYGTNARRRVMEHFTFEQFRLNIRRLLRDVEVILW